MSSNLMDALVVDLDILNRMFDKEFIKNNENDMFVNKMNQVDNKIEGLSKIDHSTNKTLTSPSYKDV
jgi:hypothetical protein